MQITLFTTKTGTSAQGEKLNVTVYIDIFPITVWFIAFATLIAVAGVPFNRRRRKNGLSFGLKNWL